MQMTTAKCPTCGHNFYSSQPLSDGRCEYCHADDKEDRECIYCGSPATCTGHFGYMCDSEQCDIHDHLEQQREYDKALDEDYY